MPAAESCQKLFTPNDTAVVFIDHQPQMTFGVDNINKQELINNVSMSVEASCRAIACHPPENDNRGALT